MQPELSVGAGYAEEASDREATISEMARTFDVSLRTLRFYEDKGLLAPRRHGTARFYGPADRIRLQLILKGKHLGFTLAEIAELIASREKKPLSTRAEDAADLTVQLDRTQIAAQIAHLERQRADLDHAIEELKTAFERMKEPIG